MSPCSHSQIEHQHFCPLRNSPLIKRPIRLFRSHTESIKDPRKVSLFGRGGAQDSLRCRHTARAAEVTDSNGPEERFPVSTEIFPRIRESNPWRQAETVPSHLSFLWTLITESMLVELGPIVKCVTARLRKALWARPLPAAHSINL